MLLQFKRLFLSTHTISSTTLLADNISWFIPCNNLLAWYVTERTDDKEYIEIINSQLLIEHNNVFALEDEDKSSQLVISVKALIILGN